MPYLSFLNFISMLKSTDNFSPQKKIYTTQQDSSVMSIDEQEFSLIDLLHLIQKQEESFALEDISNLISKNNIHSIQ